MLSITLQVTILPVIICWGQSSCKYYLSLNQCFYFCTQYEMFNKLLFTSIFTMITKNMYIKEWNWKIKYMNLNEVVCLSSISPCIMVPLCWRKQMASIHHYIPGDVCKDLELLRNIVSVSCVTDVEVTMALYREEGLVLWIGNTNLSRVCASDLTSVANTKGSFQGGLENQWRSNSNRHNVLVLTGQESDSGAQLFKNLPCRRIHFSNEMLCLDL